MNLFEKYFESTFDSGSEQKGELGLDDLFSSKKPTNPYPKKYSKDLLFELNDETEFDSLFSDIEILIDLDEDSTENKLNKARSNNLDKNYTRQFINLLKEEDFEFGYSTRSEELLNEQLKINALATRNWLNEIFIKNFHDHSIIIGILRIIGRFEPSVIFPQGQTIALAALSHSSDEIKELGIRAFEKWCSIESLEILKSLNVETPWLNEYVKDVIEDFEEQLCLY